MSRLLAVLALSVAAGPAAACINDMELSAHEREFRSSYRGAEPPPASSPEPAAQPSDGLVAGTGVVLLAAALTLAATGRKPGE